MQVRDRIKELRRVPAAQLRPNARNWRTHPENQRAALRGILAEVGYAGALLARELPDGSLELIDGHLRAETTPDALVPVLVLDVTEEESLKLLATFDPLSSLAETNRTALDEVLSHVETDSDALRQLLADLAAPPAPGRDESDSAGPTVLARALSNRGRVPERGRATPRLRADQRPRAEMSFIEFIEAGNHGDAEARRGRRRMLGSGTWN